MAKLDERYIERRHAKIKLFWHAGQRGGGFRGKLKNTGDTLKRVFVSANMHARALMLSELTATNTVAR